MRTWKRTKDDRQRQIKPLAYFFRSFHSTKGTLNERGVRSFSFRISVNCLPAQQQNKIYISRAN